MTVTILVIILISGLLALFFVIWYNEKLRRRNVSHYVKGPDASWMENIRNLVIGAGKKNREDLELKFINAGIYNTRLIDFYVPTKITFSMLVFTLFYISDMTQTVKVVIGFFSVLTVFILPDIILSMRKKVLINHISRQLPYMLDMMSVCLKTGMTIESSLAYLAKELIKFDEHLCFHLKITADSARIIGLEKALKGFFKRVPTPESRSFTLTLIQNIQYGTSIAHVLSDLAEDIRKIQVLDMEEKIGQLSAKMSVPLILLIMFPIVVLILAPGFMQLMTSAG